MSNNVLNFPNSSKMKSVPNQNQINPIQILANQFKNGMSPMAILNRMYGPQVNQARSLIEGKNQDQLRQIAINMAAQRGVDLNSLAQHMGIPIPK